MNQKALIESELLRLRGNVSAVARGLGLSYHGVQALYPKDKSQLPFVPTTGPEPKPSEIAKPSLAHLVIAMKRAGCGWPSHYDKVLKDARRKYDAGTHEMFQESVKGWVIQYLQPRLIRTPKRSYFSYVRNF